MKPENHIGALRIKAGNLYPPCPDPRIGGIILREFAYTELSINE